MKDWEKPGAKIRILGPAGGWKDITLRELRKLPRRETISVSHGPSTLYTVYRPVRHRDESPLQYANRTGCTPDDFTRIHKGWFYCNPAHCSGRWRKRAARDAHLEHTYAILAD